MSSSSIENVDICIPLNTVTQNTQIIWWSFNTKCYIVTLNQLLRENVAVNLRSFPTGCRGLTKIQTLFCRSGRAEPSQTSPYPVHPSVHPAPHVLICTDNPETKQHLLCHTPRYNYPWYIVLLAMLLRRFHAGSSPVIEGILMVTCHAF